jgi:hypothetical protein
MKINLFAFLTLFGFIYLGFGNHIKAINFDYGFFIENKGQWNSNVLYLCRMKGLDAWITKSGINFTFYKNQLPTQNNEGFFEKKRLRILTH